MLCGLGTFASAGIQYYGWEDEGIGCLNKDLLNAIQDYADMNESKLSWRTKSATANKELAYAKKRDSSLSSTSRKKLEMKK